MTAKIKGFPGETYDNLIYMDIDKYFIDNNGVVVIIDKNGKEYVTHISNVLIEKEN